MARAKHASSRRGRRRFSRGVPGESQPLVSPSAWVGYEDVLPLEGIVDDDEQGTKSRSQGLDYAELLAQDPVIGTGDFSGVFSRGLDPFEDAFADLYAFDDPETSTAPFLSLDLELLGQRLAKVSLKKRLFLDDETLPSELLVSDEEDTSPRDGGDVQEQGATSSRIDKVDSRTMDFQRENVEGTRTEVEDVKKWLDTALQDPENGKALSFKDTVTEQSFVPQRDEREAELDALLDLLDNVAIEDKEDGVKLGNVSGGGLDFQLVGDEQSSTFMSQKDLETLLWSPPEDAKPHPSTSVSPLETEKRGVTPPALEEDFDAWLDSFD
ncbi:uncharacterized protein LOC9647051 [Selaginella moellendorffii]|uniref:uncharacterized protein LOC9647051 n=1 Tax=Selaginella moellendorffii TaxID=88036 RepID=UPI000D1C8AD7|nr:uncharacterized protein LOC9647051 [Selaginella moellendorffii]XP_024540901.1 uncharacterized protein LOC9647051 [Selaginella moellendorffii]|eukprot:XP_024540900.1 uncharacterized protein LOC9647051 [Selaginella moellendorffii]